ncbi:MAG TPA: hypothetical protein VM529_16040, partial [Gemmata sp.]|nr:hypothetical protein [Gemmata sp.]
MRQTRPFRPTLESLEDRAVPATVVVSGGNLEVSGQVGTLVVETTAIAGLLRVTDDTGTVRASGVTGRVRITGDGLGNVIRIAANAGSKLALPGVLVVNAGNGNDQVFLSGKVNGNVRINTGLGNDLVTSDDAAVRVGGSLSLFDEAGANTFSMNGVNYKIARDATFTGLGTFQTGAGNTLSVGGTLTMTANTVTPLDITLGGASAVVGGDLVVSGGEAGDVL